MTQLEKGPKSGQEDARIAFWIERTISAESPPPAIRRILIEMAHEERSEVAARLVEKIRSL